MKNQSRQANDKKDSKKASRLFIAHASSLRVGEKNISRGQNEGLMQESYIVEH
jgi:hypothetical protein